MVYICTKDFDKDRLSVKKGEIVNMKFGHEDERIHCYYITHKGEEHIFYNDKILEYFTNLVKWRNLQIEKIIEEEED